MYTTLIVIIIIMEKLQKNKKHFFLPGDAEDRLLGYFVLYCKSKKDQKPSYK